MAFGAFDNQITRRGYVTAQMDEIWSERSTVQSWYDVEAALARVQTAIGMIPEGTGARITEQAQATDAVMEQIFGGGTGNPFALGLDALRSALDDDRRPWVHYGATTQDILDTARGLQIRDSLDLIDDCTDKLLARIRDLAGVHAKTLMVARTNGQHAVPTTLGMRFARWAADLERSRDRLTETRQRCLLVQFSGAAGTYASMGEHGTTVAMGVAQELGLVCELIAWHASRDGLTELACNLAIHAQTLAKIAEDLYDMQRTDFQEAAEALDPHLSGSSTMPQKRNPFSTMKIPLGAPVRGGGGRNPGPSPTRKTPPAARMAAGAAATVLTNPPGDFERDHRQLEVERDAIPRILAAVDGAGQKLLKLLDVLEFNTGQLDVNARREGVLLVSEGIMMELASRLGHEGAHDLLQEFSAAYRAAGTSLREFVDARPEIAEKLDDIDLDKLSDPSSYTGLSAELSRRVAAGQPHTGTGVTE